MQNFRECMAHEILTKKLLPRTQERGGLPRAGPGESHIVLPSPPSTLSRTSKSPIKPPRIELKRRDYYVIIINNEFVFGHYKEDIRTLRCLCEPGDLDSQFDPFLDTGELYFLMMSGEDGEDVIGYIKTAEIDSRTNTLGISKDKKGMILKDVCGNDKYQGVASPILKEIDIYAKDHGYGYILLLAAVDRFNLHTGTEDRPGLYKKNGYEIIGGPIGYFPSYYVMRKDIQPIEVESELESKSGSEIPQLTAKQTTEVCVCVYECNESMATHAQYLLCATSRCRRHGNRLNMKTKCLCISSACP